MVSSTKLLDDLLEPVGRALSADAARKLLELRATPEVQKKMDYLAERCNEALLTESERADHQALISVTELIAVLQAQARVVLSGPTAA